MTDVISAEALERAIRYPYAIPATHFRFDPAPADTVTAERARIVRADVAHRDGETIFYDLALELDGVSHHLPAVCPVISAGSNASPQQLHRKFHGRVHEPVYGLRCRLSDWVPAYSAHFSGYGAIAGCLQPWPGAQSQLFVTLLTPPALVRMHETETLGVHYRFTRLSGTACLLDGEPLDFALYYYECLHGVLMSAALSPILMAAFEVGGCPLHCMSEEAVLRAAMRDLFPDLTLEAALARIVASGDTRREATAQLKALRIAVDAAAIASQAG